jgi:hypothetical protein
MARVVVDMNTLDQLVRDELDKTERAKDFGVTLWREAPDGTGANWNAIIKRLPGNGSFDRTGSDVVARLRASFSLDGERD